MQTDLKILISINVSFIKKKELRIEALFFIKKLKNTYWFAETRLLMLLTATITVA